MFLHEAWPGQDLQVRTAAPQVHADKFRQYNVAHTWLRPFTRQVGVVRLSRETLQALLTKTLAMNWTPAQAAILACTEGTESVVEAVARVRSLSAGQVRPSCR